MEAWLEPLLRAEESAAVDGWAIEQAGVLSLDLMERAGSALARVAATYCPNGRIAVVCGKGNNGGDGFVAARHLKSWGHEVFVFLTADPGELKGDARTNFERISIPASPLGEDSLVDAECVVDALLGTGFAGVPWEPVAGAIEAINGCGAVVVSADVPSGVDVSTGEASVAVRARATVTFGSRKLGLSIWPGKELAGEIEVVDIGIPTGAPVGAVGGLITGAVLNEIPRRGERSSKFTAGVVTVIGGSTGLTGAPSLTAMAAQRAGAGYVTVGVPESLNLIFEERLLEAMTVPLSDSAGALTPAAVDVAVDSLGRGGALVLGPGLGRSEDALGFVRELLARLAAESVRPRIVLDADGLNAFGGRLSELGTLSERLEIVLTPHEGELGRLLGIESAELSQRRLHFSRLAASQSGAIVVLKGDDTIVATPDGHVAVSAGGCPALATAGTGDVLSGVIGAFLAKSVEPFAATCAGVQAHLESGRKAADAVGSDGMVASDVIGELPAVLTGAHLRG